MANQIVPSSSFSSTPSWTYDVFLSFRGEDTRYNFTDHLYHALNRHGINTFIDHCELPTGENISPTLLEAIDKSRISIIVFSENYASSRWCLDELVHILECRKSKGQMTRPIFYKVDPSDVRHQRNSYGAAFADHSRKYENNLEKVQRWRTALTEAANLKGATLSKGEYETTFINGVVKEISTQVLNRTYLHVAKYPVGIESCVEKVEKLLGVGGNDRRVVGIWGTSGIGKTTIAKAVHNAIAHKFEGSCFLADVRETSALLGGVVQLQNTFLSKILRRTELKIVDYHEGISLIKNRLSQKKILLILDDVDQLKQLENLFEVSWFGEGSRVIITTKDRGLLKTIDVELIYKVQKLHNNQALKLLCLNAFGSNEPPKDYLRLARHAIACAQGFPLALNIIGSHLRNKRKDRWQAILDGYDSCDGEPYTDIQIILRKSYDALNYGLQKVFLDIACFFKGGDKDEVLQILRSSKLGVRQDCIEALDEKAIITIGNNKIWMHDLLEQMGKRIVWEESPDEPGKRSRLWHHEDVRNVLTESRGTKKIRGIVVNLPEPDVIPLNAKSFSKMINLEMFINRNACFSGCLDYLSNNLGWLDLGGRSNIKHTVVFNLPSNYNPRHLVKFDVSYSDIRQLNGFKNLAKLTWMNLSGCKFLEKIPDLSGSPNIKKLDLCECKLLVEVDDSVGFLDKLEVLYLSGCSKLKRFPTRLRLRSLERLYLDGCTRLESFPEIEEEMEVLSLLDIRESGIRELPSSIAYLTGLEYLGANGCELQNLHLLTIGNKVKFDGFSTYLGTSVDNLYLGLSTYLGTSVDNLYLGLGGCNLSENDFLVPLDCWPTLVELDLSRNNFVILPGCISKFVNLKELGLGGCKRLREIPQVLPPKLLHLYLHGCTSLEKIPKLPPMLEFLDLTNCIGLSGDEVAKFENNLLNEEYLRRSQFQVIYPGNKVPKWSSFTSNHATTIQYEGYETKEDQKFVGGNEFCFEIPLNLQVRETLGLALSFVFEPPTYNFDYTRILIDSTPTWEPFEWLDEEIQATHVSSKLVDLRQLGYIEQDDICEVKFQFGNDTRIKSCGVHRLLRNQDELLPLSLGPASSLRKRPRPLGSTDIVDNEYGQQQQWLSLSSEPADDHPKRRQIDLNVPIDIEVEEKQEQPSTSDDPQFLIY